MVPQVVPQLDGGPDGPDYNNSSDDDNDSGSGAAVAVS